MRSHRLGEAYHIERAVAARQGIQKYPCGCEKCHGFKIQEVEVVGTHHRKYGRDKKLEEPLLQNAVRQQHVSKSLPTAQENVSTPTTEEEVQDEEQYFDATDFDNFEEATPNREVNLEDMAQNYFARADEIHQQFSEEEDAALDFDDLSSEDDEADQTDVMEELLREVVEPLFPGSNTSKLQFSIILMSLTTLFSVSHHCLDEILTFLKHDVLPTDNACPQNSYEMKSMLMKLGLSHEIIHCCDCGKTLYWKDKAGLDSCPECGKARYIDGSRTVPLRVLRYFSVIKRLRRMFRCPELSKHMTWHARNHSQDGKMRSVVDSEQWRFIDEKFPTFSRSARNVRMGLSLDGVNPYGMQNSKHSVWPVMMVLYNLPPYLLTKRFFICLTMIIPGPKSPTEDNIDVYLQPLVHELKKLWVGVPAVDMSKPIGPSRHFNMRGMLMWTINDFLAYTLISGQTGKGLAGCPVCGEGTAGQHSVEASKTIYFRNRRWLKRNHQWRSATTAFNGYTEHDVAPPRQSGHTIIRRGAWRESFLQCGGHRNSKYDPVKCTGVKRVSILFELPYWKDLPTRHLLDPMHCEKNVCETLVRTLFGETDGVKSREDMRARGIRKHLHLQANPDGRSYFMPDAPYVLTKKEREEFLATLSDLKFPSNYVGPLKQRIKDGRLSGLKTHDYHILLQQVLPVCLRNVKKPKVVGAIMRVSRLFKRICSKVVDCQQKVHMLEDVAETICLLEKELPPSIFVVMMHLPIHLVEELFICGPVHTWWMYPFERYMKALKGFVKNKAKPEGSMANGYLREESIGFLTEYLAEYTPTTKRTWDADEEPAMYDEVLEGGKRDRFMSPQFRSEIHNFVLDNCEHLDVYRRRYEEAVTERNVDRDNFRRQHHRRGRRATLVYPMELQKLPDFCEWILQEVRREQQFGVTVSPMVVDTARGPLEVAAIYKSMFAFGNHFRVLSSERSLKTMDSGVAATFRQVCRNGMRDVNQVEADVEYVGHIEEILELNYRRHCVVVLVCDFVKANYCGQNATMKRDKWGFTLANYARRPGIVCRDSFAFPKHCEQVFYCNAKEAPGWKIVLRKEVRGRRVLPCNEDEREPEMFRMGEDEEFEGLRPAREVGEGPSTTIIIGQDVMLEEVFIARTQTIHRRPRGIESSVVGEGHAGRRAGRRGRGGRGLGRGRPPLRGVAGVRQSCGVSDAGSDGSHQQMNKVESNNTIEEDRDEEELLYAEYATRDDRSQVRVRENDNIRQTRRIRRRLDPMVHCDGEESNERRNESSAEDGRSSSSPSDYSEDSIA